MLLLNPALGTGWCRGSDQLLSAFTPPVEPTSQPAHWLEAPQEERQGRPALRIHHGKVGGVRGRGRAPGRGRISPSLTSLQPVAQVAWQRGDYLAVVLATPGHTQVLIHQLSRRSQSPSAAAMARCSA